MSTSRQRRTLALGLAPLALIAVVPAGASAATAFYGVTSDQHLAEFTSDNTATAPVLPIRGLAPNEKIVGLDLRPADGRLYGLTSGSRIVVFNPRNAQVTYVGTKAIDPALTGDRFGFDFNPTVDKIRIESNAAQNLRIDPATGQLVATTTTPTPAPTTPENTTPGTTPTPVTTPGKPDGNLAYAAGDPGAGTAPKVTAAAYTNSFPIGTTTDLFVLDSARGVLAKQDPPNDGTLKTVGALGKTGTPIAFDIAEDNAGFAVLGNTSGTQASLYRVNLQTGAATSTGAVNVVGTRSPLVALAAAGQIGDDTAAPKLSVSASSVQLASRLLSGGVQLTVNANEAVTGTARVKYRNRTVGTASVDVQGGAGYDRVVVDLNGTARAAIRRSGGARLDLSVEVADGAGNTSKLARPIRTR